jgi:signal transduction histidine kinase
MRTLFARILLWFLATATIAVLGFVAVSARLGSYSPRAREPLLRAARFLAGEAVNNYEEGGRAAVTDLLARIESTYNFRGALTDSEGRSLSEPPQDFRPLVERAKQRRVFLDRSRDAIVYASPVQGRRGSYWFFLLLPRRLFGFWSYVRRALEPWHLWVFGCIVLLSYVLARQLTKPVLQLRAAAERLGRGDFQARVRSNRSDELGELARTFDSMAERIEHAVTAQRQLLQDVSHELRSPLSRLSVAVELTRTSKNPAEALDRVEREAQKLNALVGELLAMTRDELRTSAVNLRRLLSEVVEEVEIEAQARGCRVVLDGTPEILLNADARLLKRAVENVTRNAVHYTAPGTDVHVGAQQRDGRVEITVQDAGPGVPEESLPRLFDAFYRVERDRDRSTGGVGLGLSIARRAVELHGGRISACNTHPGLRVVLSLPVSRMVTPAEGVKMKEKC